MEIKLGQEVRDVITGFKGRVVGLCEFLTGCKQALIAPWVDAKGDMPDARYVDVDRLEVTGEALIFPILTPGGPGAPVPPERRG